MATSADASGAGRSTARVHGRRSARQQADDRDLVARARREGTPEARRAAVEALMPLARSLAFRYHRGTEPLEDLEQVAYIGLLRAIDGFDLTRDTPFGAYAVPTIVGELRRHFRDKGWTVRVPRALQELSPRLRAAEERLTVDLGRPPTAAELADWLQVSVEQVLEGHQLDSAMYPSSLDQPQDESDGSPLIEQLGAPDDGYARTDYLLSAGELLSRLPRPERQAVELRFTEELTQSEIAARLGCSQMHVSRLLRRALGQLQAAADADAA